MKAEEEEGRGYIEMDLGVGVREERRGGVKEESDESESGVGADANDERGDKGKEEVMRSLLGSPKEKQKAKVKIEDLGDG